MVAAYLLGRRLGRAQAVAAGLAVALAPSALSYLSLKQYTADAFVTLLLLWLTARLVAGWSRPPAGDLCLACVPAVLISHVTVFVSMAVLAALPFGPWPSAAGTGWSGSSPSGSPSPASRPPSTWPSPPSGDNPAMTAWWAADLVPLGRRLRAGGGFAGRPVRRGPAPGRVRSLAAGRAVVAGGLVALWRARLPVVVAAVGLLAAELLVAAAAHRYPLLEERTSLFFTTLLTVCGALGIASVAAWSARRLTTLRWGSPSRRRQSPCSSRPRTPTRCTRCR